MLSIEKRTEIAHDLMLIQQERMMFYEQAGKLSGRDEDFFKCIQALMNQCMDCILELRPYAESRKADPADCSDVRGDIYHHWRKLELPSNCQHSDLVCACEQNEKAITTAYEKALVQDHPIGKNLRLVFTKQLERILDAISMLQSQKKPSVPEPVQKEKGRTREWSVRVTYSI